MHVAGADPQLEHDRGVGGFRELEAFLHHLHDLRQVRPGVEQPHLRLHREGMAALLDDRGALAVVLPQHHQRAAAHAGRGEIGERVGGHVGSHRGLERNGAANRVVDGGTEHGRGSGFGSVSSASAARWAM